LAFEPPIDRPTTPAATPRSSAWVSRRGSCRATRPTAAAADRRTAPGRSCRWPALMPRSLKTIKRQAAVRGRRYGSAERL